MTVPTGQAVACDGVTTLVVAPNPGPMTLVYADADPGLRTAAERSVLAHLDKLEREGRVRRSGRARRPRDVPFALSPEEEP